MTKAIIFDLFFTLIVPRYNKINNEYDVLNMSDMEWEIISEDDELYKERAMGKVKSGEEIMEKIIDKLPYEVDMRQKRMILTRRENRMKNALNDVNENVIHTLRLLKSQNIKLCLISNADTIDCKYWRTSALSEYFDEAIFSCQEGLMKPDVKIYELAMKRLGVKPEECIFVGDGGSNELAGARNAKIQTVFSEYFERKSDAKRNEILKDADYYIDNISQLLDIIKCDK